MAMSKLPVNEPCIEFIRSIIITNNSSSWFRHATIHTQHMLLCFHQPLRTLQEKDRPVRNGNQAASRIIHASHVDHCNVYKVKRYRHFTAPNRIQ